MNTQGLRHGAYKFPIKMKSCELWGHGQTQKEGSMARLGSLDVPSMDLIV